MIRINLFVSSVMLVSLTCFDNKNPYYFLKKKKKKKKLTLQPIIKLKKISLRLSQGCVCVNKHKSFLVIGIV